MRHLHILSVASLCITSGLTSACADIQDAQSPTDSATSSDSIATAAEALSIGGMTVTWNYVATRATADRIAACHPYLYVLDTDHKLYQSLDSTISWTYKGYPFDARDIGCSSAFVVWALNENKDFYQNPYQGDDSKWVYRGKANAATHMGSGTHFSALNGDGTTYTYNVITKKWVYGGAFGSTTTEASSAPISSTSVRWFVVKGGDVQFTDGTSSTLTPFPLTVGGVRKTIRDVSAESSDEVWALTDEHKLYKAKFVETNCTDGIDNDRDGYADARDADCHQYYGQKVCSMFKTSGDFCISRYGVESGGLATCNGSTLVETSGGNGCVEVGDGGEDYLYFIVT